MGIVLKTENTVEKLSNFIGFDKEKHIYLHKYLKLKISSKNIGYWKKFMGGNRVAMDIISKEMENTFIRGDEIVCTQNYMKN